MLERQLVGLRLNALTLLLAALFASTAAGRVRAEGAPFLLVGPESTVVAPGQEVDLTFNLTCFEDSAYIWFRIVADRNWIYARSMDIALVRAGSGFAMSKIATVPDTASSGIVTASCEILFGSPQAMLTSAPFRVARVFGRGRADTSDGKPAVSWPIVISGVTSGTFERRSLSDGAWMPVGLWSASSPEQTVQFVDSQADPGAVYEYRAVAPFGKGTAVSEVARVAAPIPPAQYETRVRLERVTYAARLLQLHFKPGSAGNGRFSIYDVVGRRLVIRQVAPSGDVLTVPVGSDFSTGVYLALYEDGLTRDLVKFVVVP